LRVFLIFESTSWFLLLSEGDFIPFLSFFYELFQKNS